MQEQEQNAESAETGLSTFQHLISKRKKGFRRHALLFWALMGPGLLTMIGDNDAGGVLEYVITGAHFGIGLFIPLVACLALITFTVCGYAERIHEAYFRALRTGLGILSHILPIFRESVHAHDRIHWYDRRLSAAWHPIMAEYTAQLIAGHFGCDLHWILDEGTSGTVRWRIELGICDRHLHYSSEHFRYRSRICQLECS